MDAKRFAQWYQPIAQTAPMQLYWSAAIFTPKGSPVRKNSKAQWLSLLSWIKQPWPAVDQHWDPCLQVFEAGKVVEGGLAWSPSNPNLLAFGCRDGTAGLLDVPTTTVKAWVQARTRDATDRHPPSLAFSPKGDRLATITRKGGFKIADLDGSLITSRPVGHRNFRDQLCFSPEGRYLAAVFEKQVHFCSVTTGKTLRTFVMPMNCHIRSFAFSNDGRFFAAGAQNWVRIWTLQNARDAKPEVLTYHKSESVTDVAFSTVWGGTTSIAIRLRDGQVIVRDMFTKEETDIPGYSSGDEPANTMSFSPDGRYLGLLNHLQGQPGSAVTLWERLNGQAWPVVAAILEYPYSRTLTFAFSLDGRIATLSTDQTAKIWDIEGQAARAGQHLTEMKQMAFTPGNDLLISTASTSPMHRLWYPEDWTPVNRPVTSLWDPVSGMLRGHLDHFATSPNGENEPFTPDGAIAIDPAGRFCALGLGNPEHSVVVWDIGTRKASILRLHASPSAVQAEIDDFRTLKPMKFAPDGQMLGSTAGSNILVLWTSPFSSPPTEWTVKHRICCRSPFLTAFEFSPDCELVATVAHNRLPDDPYPRPPRYDVHGKEMESTQRPRPYLMVWAVADERYTVRRDVPPIDQQPSHQVVYQGRNYVVDMIPLANGFFEPRWRSMDDQLFPAPGGRLTVSWEDGWVRYDGQDILWLPVNYRSACFAVGGETVALARDNGEVMWLRFDEVAIQGLLGLGTKTA